MRVKRTIISLACLLLAGQCLAGPVDTQVAGLATDTMPTTDLFADDAAQSATLPDSLVFGERVQAAASAGANFDTGIGVPVDTLALERLRGGESTVDNDVLLEGTVENNTADRIVSGSNAISDGAFTNANGINTVIQNTGSNVLIQNGMVVNVQFVAPTP